jgi:hypothetical protein
MNLAYLGHLWRANRLRLLVVSVALLVWGTILPIIFDSFGEQFRELMDSGIIPPQIAQFGGGDIFSLTGSVALGFIHPLAVGLCLVFAVGFPGASGGRSRSCSPGRSRGAGRTPRPPSRPRSSSRSSWRR